MSDAGALRAPRYTIVHALGSWHVFDTHRAEPVAFSGSPYEAHTRARAATYNHYRHLTLGGTHMIDADLAFILNNQAIILGALGVLLADANHVDTAEQLLSMCQLTKDRVEGLIRHHDTTSASH